MWPLVSQPPPNEQPQPGGKGSARMPNDRIAPRGSAAFHFSDLVSRRAAQGRPYLEFLRVDSLSAGLYVLPAGGEDLQKPHTEDEVYMVMSGRGRFRAGNDDRAVGPGDILYVRRTVEHRFHSIDDELRILVFFAPAEAAGKG